MREGKKERERRGRETERERGGGKQREIHRTLYLTIQGKNISLREVGRLSCKDLVHDYSNAVDVCLPTSALPAGLVSAKQLRSLP